MQITLTTKNLADAGACPEGVAAFKEMFGEIAVVEWTAEKQVEILRGPLSKHLGWASAQGLVPMWAMTEANLAGANLEGACLRGACLAGANLARAKLEGADLTGADLCNAMVCKKNETVVKVFGWLVERGVVTGASTEVSAK